MSGPELGYGAMRLLCDVGWNRIEPEGAGYAPTRVAAPVFHMRLRVSLYMCVAMPLCGSSCPLSYWRVRTLPSGSYGRVRRRYHARTDVCVWVSRQVASVFAHCHALAHFDLGGTSTTYTPKSNANNRTPGTICTEIVVICL
eukprot:887821-Rhodomonas_salina.1